MEMKKEERGLEPTGTEVKFPFSIACEPQTYLSQDGLCEALGEALLAGSPYIYPLAKQFAKL